MNQRSILAGAVVLACVLLASCSNTPPIAAPVEPEKARAALKTVLDAWQAGEEMGAQASKTPEIVVQDLDWMQGSKLVSYEIDGAGLPQDANLRVDVELNLSDRAGRSTSKRVTYIVGTDPTLTVFRSFD